MKYIRERFEISSNFKDLVLLSKEQGHHFMLYNTKLKTPIGYICANYYESVDVFTIDGAYTERGYGPFLYECVMTQVFPKGISMTRESNTSDSALNVWEIFDTRSDVRKERMYSDEITHKKEDLPNSGIYDEEPQVLERILELEDTRFFYTFGKTKLDHLLEIGRKYKQDNDITDDKIEYMSWDME